jgi:hypothetical protein
MNRRFEFGPIPVLLGASLLLVSLFLEWYGPLNAWDAFEVVDVLLAALAVAGVLGAANALAPGVDWVERRWLPAVAIGVVVLVAGEIIDPPPAAADLDADGPGAWIALGAAALMLIGTVLSLSRVSLSVNVERRDVRRHVPTVDERPPSTDSGAVVAPAAATQPTEPTEPVDPSPPRGAA